MGSFARRQPLAHDWRELVASVGLETEERLMQLGGLHAGTSLRCRTGQVPGGVPIMSLLSDGQVHATDTWPVRPHHTSNSAVLRVRKTLTRFVDLAKPDTEDSHERS